MYIDLGDFLEHGVLGPLALQCCTDASATFKVFCFVFVSSRATTHYLNIHIILLPRGRVMCSPIHTSALLPNIIRPVRAKHIQTGLYLVVVIPHAFQSFRTCYNGDFWEKARHVTKPFNKAI